MMTTLGAANGYTVVTVMTFPFQRTQQENSNLKKIIINTKKSEKWNQGSDTDLYIKHLH